MENSAESARERAEIDAGQTRDKVALGDPAIAPLGTDAEASGTPTPAWAMREAVGERWRVAREAVPERHPQRVDASGHTAPAAHATHPALKIAMAICALLAVAAAAILLTLP